MRLACRGLPPETAMEYSGNGGRRLRIAMVSHRLRWRNEPGLQVSPATFGGDLFGVREWPETGCGAGLIRAKHLPLFGGRGWNLVCDCRRQALRSHWLLSIFSRISARAGTGGGCRLLGLKLVDVARGGRKVRSGCPKRHWPNSSDQMCCLPVGYEAAFAVGCHYSCPA